MRYRFLFLLIVLPGLFTVTGVSAQVSVRDSSVSMVLLSPNYAFQVPGGDMAKRFGVNNTLGFSITYKNKRKWYLSAEGNFMFGGHIKEPGLYSHITTASGFIIGSDGLYANVRTFERGYYMMLSYGRLFSVKHPNPNCGFFIQAGAGFMQHKIKVQDKKHAVPSLQNEYLKGYDHLANGLAFKEMAGYLYTGSTRLVNFFAGIEFIQGFTAGRRDYIFDTMAPDKSSRLDLLFGIRAGWIMPLYKEAPDKYYIY